MLQCGDDLRQRRNGLRAVAAAVVHQDDSPSSHVRAGSSLDYVRDAGPAPVPRIDAPQHLTKAQLTQNALHGQVACSVRWPHAATVRPVRQLPLNLTRRQLGQVWMAVCVVADTAALRSDPVSLSRVLGLAEAELEEGGCGVRSPQDIQDGRCVRTGSVVEGEIDDSATLDRCLGA